MGRAAGYVRIDRPDGPPLEYDTLMCVHCNLHWYVEPGSGKQRGFCTLCNGPHCGGRNCWRCIPLEKKVEEGLARMRLAAAMGLVTK
jgi:hypothetical protein